MSSPKKFSMYDMTRVNAKGYFDAEDSEKAHSCYFSRDAFEQLTGGNKELLIIPGAVHADLYDRTDIIPFDKLETFFRTHLCGGN